MGISDMDKRLFEYLDRLEAKLETMSERIDQHMDFHLRSANGNKKFYAISAGLASIAGASAAAIFKAISALGK